MKQRQSKDEASSAQSAKKAYGEELRRQAELDRERKRDGRLADKIGSPPRQARSLPSDAPVEPNWRIACNGQQLQSQVPSQPVAAGPPHLHAPTPEPFQRDIHEGLLQPLPHGPGRPSTMQHSTVAPARTPRTPAPQPAVEEEYGGFPRGMGQADDAAKEKRRNQQEEYRRFLQMQQQRDRSPGAENRRRLSQMQGAEPDQHGGGFAIGAQSADVLGRRQRQEEMRHVLAEQMQEKEKQKKLEKELRKKEELDEMERLRREADEEKRKYEAEKEREAQKKRALLQEGQEAAAKKLAEKEAEKKEIAAEKAEAVGVIPPPAKAASASVHSESSGTPTGSRHSHHGRHAHGRRRGKGAATPDQSHSEQEPSVEAGRPDLFGPPQPFGGCPPAPFMPSPPKPVVQPEPSHELLKGVVQQQQEIYRQQQEQLFRLQEEADKLKRDKEAAQQNLLDLKEKQVEEKELEVKKLQKKLQRHLVLNGGGDVPGGNLSDKIDVLLSPGGTAEHTGRRYSADTGGVGIAGVRGGLLPFRSKYEESAAPHAPQVEAESLNEQSSVHQGLQSQGLENSRSLPPEMPVWESSPGPLAKSGGWSEAPVPWLQDDLEEELQPLAPAGGRFAHSSEELGRQGAALHLPVRKGTDGLEDSLFGDSWGSPLTGRDNPDPVEEASLPHIDAASTVGKTLIGDSKLVAPGFQDKTWQDVRLAPRAEPSRLQDTNHLAGDWLADDLQNSWQSAPRAPGFRAGHEGLIDPVANLEAAVRAIHEVNGNQGSFEGSMHMQHGFDKDIAEVELDVTALQSEPAATSFSTLGLDYRGIASLRDRPAMQLHSSVASTSSPPAKAHAQVAGAVGSWEGMLQKFGGRPSAHVDFLEGTSGMNSLAIGRDEPRGLSAARPPSADVLASPAASLDSLGLSGTRPRGRSTGRAASPVQPSSLLNSEDFALLAAADQEDFDAFLARLQKNNEGSAPSAKAPSSLPRPKASAGAPSAALPCQHGRERVRTGSPLLRSAGSSVLRTPSSDSRPGSGGGACLGLPPSLSSSVLHR